MVTYFQLELQWNHFSTIIPWQSFLRYSFTVSAPLQQSLYMTSSHLSGFEVFSACHCIFFLYFHGSFLHLLQFLLLFLKPKCKFFKKRQKASIFCYPVAHRPRDCNQLLAVASLEASTSHQIFGGGKSSVTQNLFLQPCGLLQANWPH